MSTENEGLLHSMFRGVNTVVFNPSASSFTLDDIQDWINKLAEQDARHREILDKEYTPIEDITLQGLEDAIRPYGENVPRGLFVKIKWAGRYIDAPMPGLLETFRQLHKSFNQSPNVQECDATDPKPE